MNKKQRKEITKIAKEFCEPFYESFGDLDAGGVFIIDPLIGYLEFCGYKFYPMIYDNINVIVLVFDDCVFIPQAKKFHYAFSENFQWIAR